MAMGGHQHATPPSVLGLPLQGALDDDMSGVESFWAMLKRGYVGTYHHMSVDHLHRYVNEFAGRHNDRPADTRDQMRHIVEGMEGKRLRYDDLIAA